MNYRDIIKSELEKGRDPASIMVLAKKAGVKDTEIQQTFTALSQDVTLPFIGVLRSFLKTKKSPKPAITTNPGVWDPVGKPMHHLLLSRKNEAIKKQFEDYEANPQKLKRNLFLLSIPALLTILVVVLFPKIIEGLASMGDDGGGLGLLVLPFIPPFYYYRKVKNLQRDLVKYLIAKENKWIYNPGENYWHWSAFVARFPEFFRQGDERQNMQDEFWGKYKLEDQSIDFYAGIFEYTTVSLNRKGRTRRSQHYKNVFAIKLEKTLKSDFQLVPEHFGRKLLNFFWRQEIETESSEFNKTFSFIYNGKKDDKALEIVKTLSPAVQVQLINLSEKEKGLSVLLRGNVIIFMTNGRLIKRMKTNFFRSVALDPRDKETVENRIKEVLDISNELVKYLK